MEGQTLNRADYPRLWKWVVDNSLTTTDTENNKGLFGTGNGSTTFVMPDLTNRWVVSGGDTGRGKTVQAGLPNITGGGSYDHPSLYMAYAWYGWFNGATTQKQGALSVYMPQNDAGTLQAGSSTVGGVSLAFDASRSNPIYGNSTTVQPPSVQYYTIIKY